MLWLLLALMLLAGALVVIVPLYRRERRLTATMAVAALIVVIVPAGLYWRIGSPGADSQPGQIASIDETVASLATRLEENPNDPAGWKMLGRSYVQLRRLPEAIVAYEKAVELESSGNAQTLTDLGEAMILSEPDSIDGKAGQLFESALALAPNNPKALFYAGLAAVNRGEGELAATRWEALLATSPPANIQDILRQRIAELRGEPPPDAGAPAPTAAGDEPSAVVTVNVSLGDAAANVVDGAATVFIIARDPAQPSPPIAAVRRRASELPMTVPLSDSDAMIPGRVPSAFPELEIVARVSAAGEPVARSGDWYGERRAIRGDDRLIDIVIDQRVP